MAAAEGSEHNHHLNPYEQKRADNIRQIEAKLDELAVMQAKKALDQPASIVPPRPKSKWTFVAWVLSIHERQLLSTAIIQAAVATLKAAKSLEQSLPAEAVYSASQLRESLERRPGTPGHAAHAKLKEQAETQNKLGAMAEYLVAGLVQVATGQKAFVTTLDGDTASTDGYQAHQCAQLKKAAYDTMTPVASALQDTPFALKHRGDPVTVGNADRKVAGWRRTSVENRHRPEDAKAEILPWEVKDNATAAAESHEKNPPGLTRHREAFRKGGVYVSWKFEEAVKGENNAFVALCRRVRGADMVVFTFGMDQ